jgi:hypothetical protein
MGAALHLAHLEQAPAGPQRRRKGGGTAGDGYDKLVARVWQDQRLTPKTRELLLLVVWLICRDPQRSEDDWTLWGRATEILGVDGPGGRKSPRLAELLDDDRPRYEPDWLSDAWQGRVCAAPMIRRAGECGQHATEHALRIDRATGWQEPVWYCSRHRDFGRVAEAAYRAQDKPFPIPNRGGMLPSYLAHRGGDAGWTKLYEWASKWRFSSWKPPQGYGLVADDWPTPGVERPVSVPRLRLAALDGELLGGAL